MKRFLIVTAIAASAILTCPVIASAGSGGSSAVDWTGPYVGAQTGYSWGQYDLSVPNGSPEPPPPEDIRPDASPNVSSTNYHDNLDGFIGGIHAGYLMQMNALVFGLEGDFQGTSLSGKVYGSPTNTAKLDLDVAGSIRARAGFAVDRALIYATGGLALGDVTFKTSNSTASDSRNNVYAGYTLGAGVEYAFSDHLSTRIEYRYTDYGSHTFGSKVFPLDTFKASLHDQTVEAGISWHF